MKKFLLTLLLCIAAGAHAQSESDAKSTIGGLKATADFKDSAGLHGNGTVILNGQQFNADELVPAGNNKSYVDRLKKIDGANNLDGMREAYDELKPQIDKDPSSWAQATRTATVTPKDRVRIEEETAHDSAFWQGQLDSLGKGEVLAGDMLQECTTKTVVSPGSKELSYTEEKYCDLVSIPEGNSGEICQRQAEYSETPTTERKEKTSQLFVTEEGNGTICKRETRAENYRDTLAGTITSTIDITEEVSGLSCKREIIPESHSQDVTGTKSATLPLDTQTPADGCTRTVTKTSSEVSKDNYIDFTASMNNETGGLLCTRERTVSGSGEQKEVKGTMSGGSFTAFPQGSSPGVVTWSESFASRIPPGAVSAIFEPYIRDDPFGNDHPAACNSVGIIVQPSAANNWTATFEGWAFDSYDPYNDSCQRGGTGASIDINYVVKLAADKVFSVKDSGNCSESGTTYCPAKWSCSSSAPTVINGISVSAAEVSGLAALFPGAGSTCVSAQLSKVCSGNPETTNEISIAHLIEAGTTKLVGVAVTVLEGGSIAKADLVQIPSASNNWVAKVKITRINWAGSPVNPKVRISWKQYKNVVSIGVAESGSCGLTGTANCPTQWRCDTTAPTTVGGIPLSAAEAAQMAPLFPGASNSCAVASLHRVCSGTASMSSIISIADKIPAGVTAIRDFKVTVDNPQTGVAVVLTEAPTYANGWNAKFRVDRSVFTTQQAQPKITMTWGATITTITSKVVETGNCKDPGTEACPTRWTCDKTAPVTVNGIVVSPAMAAEHSPLFPGAANSCAAGNLSRVCDGTSSVVSSIAIGHLLSKDSTAITDFAWKVNNPQTGVTVKLVEAPSLANGWIARFQSTRDYKVSKNPAKPSITMNWNYLSELKVRTSIITTGDCSDIYGGMAAANDDAVSSMGSFAAAPSNVSVQQVAANDDAKRVGGFERMAQAVVDGVMPSASANPMLLAMTALAPSTCPLTWVCTKKAPGVANGIQVAVSDLTERGELFPGEGLTCLDAEYRRTCSGAGANRTVVSISDLVPADAETIANFGWQVVDPGQGVAIKLVQTPSKANGWKAIFETTRTDWNVKATQPTVRLAWEQKGIPDWDVNTHDQGNCSVNGDEFCQGEWVCMERYPNDPPAPKEQTSSEFSFNGPDAMGGTANFNFSIATTVPVGTAAIHDFKIGSLSGTADVAVVVVPSKANNWQGTVKVTTTGYEYEYQAGKPLSRYAQARVNFMWKVGTRPVVPPPPYRSQSPGPLFPGDDGSCKRAEKHFNCKRIWEGEQCFTDDDGQEMCVTQPKTDGPPNDCGVLEKDETCTQVREECTEGGMSSNGHCYVSTKVFECKVKVVGQDVNLREETTCTGGSAPMPCADGNCTPKEEWDGSVSSASAHLVTMQTMLIDHKPAPGQAKKVSFNLRPSQSQKEEQSRIAAAFQVIVDGIFPSAAAKEGEGDDPFGVPLPYPVPKEDPPGNPAEAFGPGVAEDMLSKMTFFEGTRESCKKMLGGLLDCCTKEPPDQQKDWWDRYRNFTRENGMAELSSMPDEWSTDGTGAWDNYDANATSMTLNQTFTSIAENVNAGGNASGGDIDATLEDFGKQFQAHSDKEIKPKLGWYCKDHEKDLAIKKNLGECTYLGSYCQSSTILGVCIVKMHVSCCFNSPVTKLIRDNFNDQGKFTYGTAKAPTCGGISLADLMKSSMTDFDSEEVEARMAAGGFSPDIAEYAGMSKEEFDVSMFGSGNSLDDPDRKGLTERTEDRLGAVGPNLEEGFDAISENIGSRSDTSNTDLVDPDSPGAITFNPGLYFVDGGKSVNIRVNRNGGKGEVGVNLRSVGGSAAAGTDYPAVNVSLSWRSGEVGDKIVTLPITNRTRSAITKIELEISNPSGGAIINPLTNGTIEIQPTEGEN